MKNATQQLTRLLKAAAAATPADVEKPSLALENRVMAQWRAGVVAGDLFGGPLLVFRRAMACAFALALLAFAWTYTELSEPPPSHVAVAEYEMQLSLLP